MIVANSAIYNLISWTRARSTVISTDSVKQGFLCEPEANRFEAYFARTFWLIADILFLLR